MQRWVAASSRQSSPHVPGEESLVVGGGFFLGRVFHAGDYPTPYINRKEGPVSYFARAGLGRRLGLPRSMRDPPSGIIVVRLG